MPWGAGYNTPPPSGSLGAPEPVVPARPTLQAGSGWGGAYNSVPLRPAVTVSTTAAKPSGGGGFWGHLASVAHGVEKTTENLGKEVVGVGPGIAKMGEALAHDTAISVEHPGRQIGPTWGQLLSHPGRTSTVNGGEL